MEDHLVADIQVLHSVEQVVIRGREGNTMSSDKCSWMEMVD